MSLAVLRPPERPAIAGAVCVGQTKAGGPKWLDCEATVLALLEAEPEHEREIGGQLWEDAAGLGMVMAGTERLTDKHLIALQSWLPRAAQMYHGAQLAVKSLSVIGRACTALAKKRQKNPIRDWLLGLQWDGSRRLATWAQTYLGVEPSKHTSAAGAWWLQQAAARGITPGCQADYSLMLYGKQGTKKSSAVAALVPNREWYLDTPSGFGEGGNKDQQMVLARRLVVELGEMQPLKRMSESASRAALTRRTESVRIPWATHSEDYPRTCAFIATTNERHPLRDPTGARRFWPLHVTRMTDTAGIERDREQLWAEAVWREQQGMRRWPETDEEQRAFAEVAEAYRDVLSYEDALRDVVQAPRWSDAGRISSSALWSQLGIETRDQQRGRASEIRDAMLVLGWEYGTFREGDRVVRGFVRRTT